MVSLIVIDLFKDLYWYVGVMVVEIVLKFRFSRMIIDRKFFREKSSGLDG